MRLLRRVGVIASGVAMLAAMSVGITAGSASAATFTNLCVFVSSGHVQQACAYYTSFGRPLTMAYQESAVIEYTTSLGSNTYGELQFNGGCIQGFANKPYNGGWSVELATCVDDAGQLWRSVGGPTIAGVRTYYYVSDWDQSVCLAWDKNAGTLFANRCQNSWYQQLGNAYGPTN
jgi:hypothetical protein